MTQDPGAASPMSERMQSLLSRAVEDQLSEQRQIAGVIGEVHAQLARIDGRLDALSQRVGSDPTVDVEQALAALAGDVRESVRLLGERLGRLQDQVEGVNSTLRELRGAFTGVASRVAELPSRADLEAAVRRDDDGPGVDERVAAAIERAVLDSERRLTDHVDEAVLALADVLLRHRPRPRLDPAVLTAPAVASAPAVDARDADEHLAEEDLDDDESEDGEDEDDEDALDDLALLEDLEEEDEEAEDDEAEDDEAEDEEAEDEADVDEGSAAGADTGDADITPDGDERAAPWETPPAQPRAIEVVAESRRKRPWWRPSD